MLTKIKLNQTKSNWNRLDETKKNSEITKSIYEILNY